MIKTLTTSFSFTSSCSYWQMLGNAWKWSPSCLILSS
jgi:hypothetical protein